MAKADYSRDYYADLELPPSADVADVKKQFRKLALKYHPDRNPGKEAEVNAKFQTIQAAHEILSSPEQKSKYDSHRSRNAYRYTGGASGVRGNPWSDVSSQYPVPPRRPGQAPTSAARNTASSSSSRASGASSSNRYSNFNAPPHTRTSKEDLDARVNAWKNMRPKDRPGQSASAAYASGAAGSGANTGKKTSSSGTASAGAGSSSSMPPPPPPHPPQTPMPPRSASQRQKANASFGTRRSTGFFPQSPMGGDEPPASTTNNYFTNRTHTNRGFYFGEQSEQPSEPTPASSAQPRRASAAESTYQTNTSANANATGDARNRSDESLFDSRQSTPYQTHGGEKFNPFDGVPGLSNLNRTKSHRTVNPQAAKPEFRRRSSSLPDESDNAAKASATPRKRAGGPADTTSGSAAAAATGATGGAAGGAAPTSTTSANTSAPRSGSRPRPGAGSRTTRPAASSQMPQFEEQYRRMQGEQQQQQQQPNPFAPFGTKTFDGSKSTCRLPKRRASNTQKSSSGDADNDRYSKMRLGMSAFDAKQYEILEGLVNKIDMYKPHGRKDTKCESKPGHAKFAGQTDQPSTDHCRQLRQNGRAPTWFQAPSQELYQTDSSRVTNNATRDFSSNLSLDDDVFSVPSTPSDQEKTNPFTRASVEDINTRFVSGEKANAAWEFSAGSSEGESRVRRSQSGSRIGRRSPGKSSVPKTENTMPPPPPPPHPTASQEPSPASSTVGVTDGISGKTNGAGAPGKSNTTTTTNYFSAGRWAEQIGSEHFVPWAANQPPTVPPRQPTPNQQKARPIKKPKPIQRTNTTSTPREYIVIDDDDDEEEGGGSTAGHGSAESKEQQRPQPAEPAPDMSGIASPMAMDIDSPPANEPTFNEPSSAESKPSRESAGTSSTTGGAPIDSSPDLQTNGARNIPVEPTRPEWRAGDAHKVATAAASTAAAAATVAAGTAPAPTSAPGTNTNPVGGSEDSEEFRATLADIRKVEPFSEGTSGIKGNAGTGLGSLGDLQSNLPFESKAASGAIPVPPRANAPGTNSSSAARSGNGRRKTITFPKAPVAPHPPPALAVPGLSPSPASWDKYVTEFRHYMQEWMVFNNLYVDHFLARRNDIKRQDANFEWLTDADSDNDGINRYLDWMDQDEEIRARWSTSCSNHDLEVRKFMAFRERMRQT
ncbi:hypothetical protein SEUCBS139899_001379 [Sporothrix eucalyptigena]